MRCTHCLEELRHAVEDEWMHPLVRGLARIYLDPGSCWRQFAIEVYEREITVIVEPKGQTESFTTLKYVAEDDYW